MDLKFVVEVQYLAVPSDAAIDEWKAIAAFAYKSDADRFIKWIGDVNGEEAYIDRRHNARIRYMS